MAIVADPLGAPRPVAVHGGAQLATAGHVLLERLITTDLNASKAFYKAVVTSGPRGRGSAVTAGAWRERRPAGRSALRGDGNQPRAASVSVFTGPDGHRAGAVRRRAATNVDAVFSVIALKG